MREPWSQLEKYLQQFASALSERPRSILVVAGHWEERVPTVNAGVAPGLIFDYRAFLITPTD